MIAVDTSTLVAYLEGSGGKDVQLLDRCLQDRQVVMVPVVLTELVSNPELSTEAIEMLAALPLTDVHTGYWRRAGELRAKVLAKGRKARLGDVLIAQACIDHSIPLLTRDRDFRSFAGIARLGLLP